jgi:hypothetical protein
MKKIALFVVILAIALLVVLPALHATRKADKRAQAIWLWSEVQHLQNLGAPPLALATNREPKAWAQDGFLVFSNGWAAFVYRTIHSPDPENIKDIALLRTSDGVFYVSYHHFCLGMAMYDAEARPRDFSQFLEIYGVEEKWTRGEMPAATLQPAPAAPPPSQ